MSSNGNALAIFVDGRVTKGRFGISHRISNAPYGLDRFHGHTYEIKAVLLGFRSKYGFIFPFEELIKIIEQICEKLNNKTLLATGGENVTKDEGNRIYYITADNKHYVFPKEDVLRINLNEVTAEDLAEWIANQLIEQLKKYTDFYPNIKLLELTLYEGRNRGVKVKIPCRK